MSKSEEIRAALEAAFEGARIEVINQSEQHRGHAGYSDGESHFLVRLSTPAFAGKSRIARHRMVHEALGRDLLARIHALALELDEAG